MGSDLQIRVEALESQQDHAGIVRVCGEALSTPRLPREDYVFALRKWARHLSALNPEGWVSEITSALRDALDEVEDNPSLTAQLLATLVAAATFLGIPSHSLEFIRRYDDLALRNPVDNVTSYRGDIRFNLARTYEAGNDLANAEPVYMEALAIFRGTGQDAKAGLTLINLAHIAVRDGRVADAKAWTQEALTLVPVGAVELYLQAMIASAEGQGAESTSLFMQALDHPTATDHLRVTILHAWAEADLHAGNRELAIQRAEDALSLAYRIPNREAMHALKAFLIKVNRG